MMLRRWTAGAMLLVMLALFASCAGEPRDPVPEPASVSSSEISSEVPTPSSAPEGSVDPDVSDVAGWQQRNRDVVACIRIEGTNVSFPILHRAGDNEYYLKHNLNGKKTSKGAIFIEDYNAADFSDPVTLIYGHRMKNGEMFGKLEKYYSSQDFMQKHSVIDLYLPDGHQTYRIFAAVPFDKRHLMFAYDFDDPRQYKLFLNEIFSVRGLNAVTDESLRPEPGEKLIVLSTCLWGDKDRRYLVIAKQILS